jgi:ABC-2 type transport system ATP-binding protein
MNALEIAHLSHAYDGIPALTNVSFSVQEGELFCVLGPNGSGKSTLFNCISTLLRPSSGQIAVADGIDLIRDPAGARRVLGTVFQEPVLDPSLTVRENLSIAASLYGISKKLSSERIGELSRLLDISDRLDARVSKLSGGLARRADLLRGILHDPAMLLLDEPTAGLDPTARNRFWQVIEEIKERNRSTILFTSHLMEEADRSDRLLMLDKGEIVAVGSSDDLRQEAPGDRILVRSTSNARLAEWIRKQIHVDVVEAQGILYVTSSDPDALFAAIQSEWKDAILELTIRKPSLEDLFFEKTGTQWMIEESVSGAHDGVGS